MRSNSSKQSEASRRNGSKSKGPKSRAGKQKVKRNALKDALFAKDVVVEEAGESHEEFNRFRTKMFKILQPTPIAEIFFNDFVENWWRRQRVRRAETVSLQCETASLRAKLDKTNDVERLGFQFMDILIRIAGGEKLESSFRREWDECRIKLSESSLGLHRLQKAFEDVESEVERTGKLTITSLNILVGCFGLPRKELLCLGRKSRSCQHYRQSSRPGTTVSLVSRTIM
jgi:hypothetical protein